MEDPAEMLSLDVIAENASSIVNALDALRGEHERVLSGVSERGSSSKSVGHVDSEKLALVRGSLEKIELGLDEAKVRTMFCTLNRQKTIDNLSQNFIVLLSITVLSLLLSKRVPVFAPTLYSIFREG